MSSSTSSRATFHFNETHHRLCDGEAASEIMEQSTSRRNNSTTTPSSTFSDWSLYQDLCQQLGCISVGLSQLHVDYSNWFLTGIQATYKCTFANSDDTTGTTEVMAPLHEFQRFRYQHYGSKETRSTLVLQDDEYIVNLAFRRVDKITDRITIQTNLRQVSFGSPDFSGFLQKWLLPRHDDCMQQQQARKIVALGGIASEMSEQLGCFSESQHWIRLKDWILTRRLVEEQRAFPSNNTATGTDVLGNNADMAMKALIIDVNDDVFRRVLSFLVPSTAS